MEETQTTIEASTKPQTSSYNPSKIQRGWDILDSITKYCIWMQPTEEYTLGVRDVLDKLRSDYIIGHDPKSFDLHAAHDRNTKWRNLYESNAKNGRPL